MWSDMPEIHTVIYIILIHNIEMYLEVYQKGKGRILELLFDKSVLKVGPIDQYLLDHAMDSDKGFEVCWFYHDDICA